MNLHEIKAYMRAFAELTIYTLGWLVMAALAAVTMTDILE